MKKETLSIITETVNILNMDLEIFTRLKLEEIFMAAAKDGFKGRYYEILRDIMTPYIESMKDIEGSKKEAVRDLVLPTVERI